MKGSSPDNPRGVGLVTKEEVWEKVVAVLQPIQRGRQFFARCPFHDDAEPSLVLSPDLFVYHCFGAGCGARGTIWRLAQLLNLLPATSSLDSLLREAWREQETAAQLVERRRKIPAAIAREYGVGWLKNWNGGAVVFPHPDREDYYGFVAWLLNGGYRLSKGLHKTVPFGWLRVGTNRPVWVVEGVFDALSLRVVDLPAVATLGNVSVAPLLSLFDGSVVLAPDNDKGGLALLWTWIREIKGIGGGCWATVYVCRWQSKDANEALLHGSLKRQVQRLVWLPVYVIVTCVRSNPQGWRSELVPYLASMPPAVRHDAVREAEQRLQMLGIKVTIPREAEAFQPEQVWLKVLAAALNDKDQAIILFNEPNFLIHLLPPSLRLQAVSVFEALEFGRPYPWVKSPFAPSAVSWAWRKWVEYILKTMEVLENGRNS